MIIFKKKIYLVGRKKSLHIPGKPHTINPYRNFCVTAVESLV